MKKLIIPIIVFISIGINVMAQSAGTPSEKKSGKEKRGDKYYFVYSFDKAIVAYTDAKKLSVEGQRRLANSYHNMDQNMQSEEAYSKLINTTGGNLPEDYYNYAMVLRSDGKYDESNKQMDKFSDMKPADLRATDYRVNKAELTNLLTDDGKFKIEHSNVNTDAEDFGTCYYKNKIVFASSRSAKLMPRKSNRNGKPFLNMYSSEVDGSQLKDPEIFDKSLDGKMNDGPASFTKDGNYMAFTRNNYDLKRKERVVKLEIYFRTYADGKWSKPAPFVLNNKEYSVGHPCLTSDGKTMYFTSDMPGGYGGADIYRVTKDEKGAWGKAENMGNKINTEGDEMFPFFEENHEILFFASNGRFGLGGLDIFICKMKGSELGTICNAGSPLNTQYDDFAVLGDDKLSKGYFSSNRTGGSGDDDIYTVGFLKGFEINKQIKGFAKDKDGNAIPKTFVTLLNDKNDVVDTQTTTDDGAFAFSADSDKNFKLIGKKEKYLDGDSITNTFGKERIVYANVILLTKEEIVAQKIQVGADLKEVLEINSIYFDLDKSNIRPDAEIGLEKIAKIMNEYPDMIVELGSHTDCRATKGYNQVLSDKRAKASAEYIKKRISKPERIYGKGYGETKLASGCACEGTVVSSCSEDVYQNDRSTEFIIIKKVTNNKLPLSVQ